MTGAVLEGLDTGSSPQSPVSGRSGESTYATPTEEGRKSVPVESAGEAGAGATANQEEEVERHVVESLSCEGVTRPDSLTVVHQTTTSSLHPSSSTQLDPKVISTADVDPDFLLQYQPETVDFPESPRFFNRRQQLVSLILVTSLIHSLSC